MYSLEEISDYQYDQYCEGIINSKDFEECELHDNEGQCSIENKRCWNVSKCPVGLRRQ